MIRAVSPDARRAIAVAAIGLVLAVTAVAVAWWIVARTRPDRVGPRFVQGLLDRRPGTTVRSWEAGILRVALPSGVYVDTRLSAVFDACAARRLACSATIDRALDDVDRVDRATRAPRRAMVRALVIGESTPGIRYGFVTEPLVGALEVRYALVDGVASTFVTGAVLDRLALTQPQLREVAMTALAAAPDVDLVQVDDQAPSVWRVRSDDDPAALLLDAGRMKQFAERLGATRLYAAVPSRGTLYLAPAVPAAGRALVALLGRRRGAETTGDAGLLAYDSAAAAGAALSSAATP